MASAERSVPLDDIVIADRHRKDLGDIEDLAESIRRVGLLHPVVLTADGQLIAGERRMAAARRLGWSEIPVTVARSVTDASTFLTAERDENTCRKDMTFSELLPLKKALEDLERPKAVERRAHDGPRGSNLEPRNKTRHVVAKALGKSATTMDKVQEVHDIAADETQPEPVRKVARQAVADMDSSGNVDRAHRKVAVAKAASGPVAEYLNSDEELRVMKVRHEWHKTALRARKDLLTWEADVLGPALDEMGWESFDRLWESVSEWFEAMRKQRIHVVKEGKR